MKSRVDTRLAVAVLAFVAVPLSQGFLVRRPSSFRPPLLVLRDAAVSAEYVETRASKKRVVVVGGGWAGFSAADALSDCRQRNDEEQLEVTLLDAAPGKGGLAGGWRTKSGRPVEAGIHGFWREYKNTFAQLERIDGVEIDEVLTPYLPSVLVSSNGRVAVAPPIGTDKKAPTKQSDKRINRALPFATCLQSTWLPRVAELLPPPLDIALLAEYSPYSPLTLADRASALGLLGAWADFGQEDAASWDRYDDVTAEDLFQKYAGVSETLYDELVSPLLHVLPMAPGYDVSAAAALSCFHVFALQTRGAFDVRWCRGGITERIFNPWAKQLLAKENVDIRNGARVTSIDKKKGESTYTVTINDDAEPIQCDAIVLAVGGTAMSRLTASSPALRSLPLAPRFQSDLRGVTCVAVRLFLKPQHTTTGLKGGQHDSTQLPAPVAAAMVDSPVVVCGPKIGCIPELQETGFCIYDLQRMHDEFAAESDVAILEVDFFRADSIADMEDDRVIARLALKAVTAALGVEYNSLSEDLLVDVAVVRARNAVSHFVPGSAGCSPDVTLSMGLYICGDWIDRKGHASWSTEKAVVTGKQAAIALAEDFGFVSAPTVLPVASDTPQLTALRALAKQLRDLSPPKRLGVAEDVPPSPWAFLKERFLNMASQ